VNGVRIATCWGCGLDKGDRDSNAGWWQWSPRGPSVTQDFCPSCAARVRLAVMAVIGKGDRVPRVSPTVPAPVPFAPECQLAREAAATIAVMMQCGVPRSFVAAHRHYLSHRVVPEYLPNEAVTDDPHLVTCPVCIRWLARQTELVLAKQ
jgi:hypothetical protein